MHFHDKSTKFKAINLILFIVRLHSLDTLFIDNNLPMQWSIKMKFAPLGSPLQSTQMRFKTTSFGEGTKKL